MHVYRVNLHTISRNFVGAIRTTTTNCRVSFIDLYLIFPTNFRIVFLPHTNTVISLEPYCGTITEPGLPVVRVALIRTLLSLELPTFCLLAPARTMTCGTRACLQLGTWANLTNNWAVFNGIESCTLKKTALLKRYKQFWTVSILQFLN